jgi:L-malate glycosyltransferase
MKILVYLHELVVSGSYLNAIDLSGGVRERGHEVVVCSGAGPLESRVRAKGLELVHTRMPSRPRPHPVAASRLRSIVKHVKPDVVHAYGEHITVEAFFGARLGCRVPTIATILSMQVPDYIPRSIPLIVGTPLLKEQMMRNRRGIVELLAPPVDTVEDAPAVNGDEFRREYDIANEIPVVAIVSRISHHLSKLDGIERSIAAVADLESTCPVTLVVVGGGPALDDVSRHANEVNIDIGRKAVVVTGPLIDPRPAYAAADVILGMGSSILRGMAFERPAIVLGERGFAKTVTPATLNGFLRSGFFGSGTQIDHPDPLVVQLTTLLRQPDRRHELAKFSRRVVCERFSLKSASARLDDIYQLTRASDMKGLTSDAIRTVALLTAHKTRGRLHAHGQE